MYHRFHAPYASRIVEVTHIAGDTFNVNPPTLQRIPRVFCRNERAVLDLELQSSSEALSVLLVVADELRHMQQIGALQSVIGWLVSSGATSPLLAMYNFPERRSGKDSKGPENSTRLSQGNSNS